MASVALTLPAYAAPAAPAVAPQGLSARTVAQIDALAAASAVALIDTGSVRAFSVHLSGYVAAG